MIKAYTKEQFKEIIQTDIDTNMGKLINVVNGYGYYKTMKNIYNFYMCLMEVCKDFSDDLYTPLTYNMVVDIYDDEIKNKFGEGMLNDVYALGHDLKNLSTTLRIVDIYKEKI